MDDVIDDFIRIAHRCRRAAATLDVEPASVMAKLRQASGSLDNAWSGSWIGYQSCVYTHTLRPARPGEYFDTQYGTGVGHGWAEFTYQAILDEVYRRAGASTAQIDELCDTANEIEKIAEDCLSELLPTLDAVLSVNEDAAVRGQRDALSKTVLRISASQYVSAVRPAISTVIFDMRAIQGGLQVPPHIGVTAHFASIQSTANQAHRISDIATYTARYLQKAMKMKGKSAAKTDGPVFIGHGGAHDWRDLKDFLTEKLHLTYEEFNRVSPAGVTNKERLSEMLDRCPFAFLVMTAEDERTDGSFQARSNVVHEAGLFQGRYGFRRAIILLEEGCTEFSNIQGLGQIRFTSGKLGAVSQQIRDVLEREGVL